MNFPDNVAAVDALGVDLLGFVFYPNSPRCVTTPPEKLPPTRAKRVGVFVDQDEEEILSVAERYGLGGVQLHGAESPAFCRRLCGGLPSGTLLIKAVGVIVLGWGIVQVGMSVQSHDASQRTQGFLCLFGGLMIAFAKEILTAIGAI